MDDSETAKHRAHSHCAQHAGTSDPLRLSLEAHKRCGGRCYSSLLLTDEDTEAATPTH